MIPGIVASQVIGALDAGGGASDAVLEYLGAHYDATNQTTYTFAGIDFGVAAADRVIIVAFKLGSDSGGNLTNSVTIGGVTATEVTSAAFADIVPIGLFYAEVPTGTSGDVVITGQNSPQNCAIQVWAAYDLDPAPHGFFSAASNGSGTSIGSVVDVPDGGFLVAAWGANHADLNASWTGAVEEAERVTGEQTFEAASDQQMAEETERSVSVSHAAATHRRMVCGTWAPGEGGGGGGDVTEPTLSSPTGTATSDTEADLSVSTNEGNGTLYWVVTQSSTGPTKAQVKLGQNHAGAAADDSGNQAVSGTGVQNAGATGLTAETEYWAHFMHEDAASNQSDVATSSSFETDAAGTLWTPDVDDLGFSMSLWFDASDDTTVTHASNVISQVNDKSGQSLHVVQATESAKPTYNPAAQNGLNTVLHASGDFLQKTSGVSPLLPQQSMTFFAVAKSTSNNSQGILTAFATATLVWDVRVETDGVEVKGSSNNSAIYSPGAGTFTGWHLVSGAVTLAHRILFTDGTQRDEDTNLDTATGEATQFRIGLGAANSHIGEWGEVIQYAGELSEDDREIVEGYLAHKWDLESLLDAGHPYKTNPPMV